MDLSKRYDRNMYDVLYPGKMLTYGSKPYANRSPGLPAYRPELKNTKSKSSSTDSSFNLGDYDYDSIYRSLLDSSSGSSGGGAYKPDITALLNAYDQQNAAANAIAKTKYDTARDNILTAINRAQQQNALDVARQNQSHINSASQLESTGAQASRETRIGDSLRGLSGSGIQQLNQLRNLISQGSKANAIAKNNTESLDKLRQSLAESSTKANQGLEDALNTYQSAISKANQTAGKNKADAIWENESNYASNLAKAAASAASSDSDYREAANDIYTNLRNTTTSLQSNLNAIKNMSTKELKKYVLANNLEDSVNTLATLDEKNISKLSKKEYRQYVARALGQNSYDLVNELNNTYGINPNNFRTAMSNISGLLNLYR